MLIKTRREAIGLGLRSVATLAGRGLLGHLGHVNAIAAGGDYKALVCIFQYGGNDGANTLIPITTGQQNYSTYQAARGALSLPSSALLPVLTKTGDQYGLHPRLTQIHSLYQQGKAALLANVGMLIEPIAGRDGYLAGTPAPKRLFSHADQVVQWQASEPGNPSPTGWGGRVADVIAPMNSPSLYPPIVMTAASDVFAAGDATSPTTVPPSGPLVLGNLTPAQSAATQQLLQFDNGLQLVQAANGVMRRGMNDGTQLKDALAGKPFSVSVTFPSSGIGKQLEMIAKIINVRASLGMSRQIFFATQGGYDTHASQLAAHDALLNQLNAALGAFYQATVDLGAASEVTTFTSSEFGRTLNANGSIGSDHAWGSNHIIMGGAVKGGDVYGKYPLLVLGGKDDASNRGLIVPSSSVDQYGATLARWFGVAPAQLSTVFPRIAKFPTSNLGFML